MIILGILFTAQLTIIKILSGGMFLLYISLGGTFLMILIIGGLAVYTGQSGSRLKKQQPPLKEVVCKPRPIGAYGAAKAAKKRNILKAKPYPITAIKGGGFSSSKTKTKDIVDRDNDSFWKGGILYFNRKDPSIFVNKRFGIGFTINFGHPLSWIIIAAVIGIVLCSIF